MFQYLLPVDSIRPMVFREVKNIFDRFYPEQFFRHMSSIIKQQSYDRNYTSDILKALSNKDMIEPDFQKSYLYWFC